MRTKIAMMIAMTVVLVALMVGSAGTAFAQMIGGVIQCQTIPCVATGDHQVLFEQVGDGVPDRMIAQGGHDHLDARATQTTATWPRVAAVTTCCASTTGTPWTGR